MKVIKPTVLRDYPEAQYHSQSRLKSPRLTYSTAKTIIQKSPYHAFLQHPKLGGLRTQPTEAMSKGSIIHSLILGGGADVEIIHADSYRTKAAQEAKADALELGKIPLLEKDYAPMHEAARQIEINIKQLAPYFFDSHESELTVRYEIEGVQCQSRWDWIQPETGRQIDLKTTKDANPNECERSIINFGYDIQQAMYTQAAEQAFPEMAGRFTWEFIFAEIEPPYMVSIIEPDNSLAWLGERRMFRAVKTWESCLKSGNWPGYGRATVSAPSWIVNREEEL